MRVLSPKTVLPIFFLIWKWEISSILNFCHLHFNILLRQQIFIKVNSYYFLLYFLYSYYVPNRLYQVLYFFYFYFHSIKTMLFYQLLYNIEMLGYFLQLTFISIFLHIRLYIFIKVKTKQGVQLSFFQSNLAFLKFL